MKTSFIWASLSAAGNADESIILLKLLNIKDAKIIFVGISVCWGGLVLSRLPISFKISFLVTWENVNIEFF